MKNAAENKNKQPLVKFCGLSGYQDIMYANMLMPDFVGFVFAAGSKRYISPEQAYRLRFGKAKCSESGAGSASHSEPTETYTLSADIKAVGVFVNEKPENVADIMNKGIIDIAQLHGSEDKAYIKRLRSLTEKPIIKAFSVSQNEFVKEALTSPADFILIDSCANGNGGTGRTFDWSLAVKIDRPFFLAGGLNAENVEYALNLCNPFAVDVSSGIETNGVKDPEKMRAFINAVRKRNIIS